MDGSVVYAGVVLIANLKILSDFNQFQIYGELIIFAMIFDYFALFFIESLIVQDLFGTFLPVMAASQTYLCLLFCVGMVFSFDKVVWRVWLQAKKVFRAYYKHRQIRKALSLYMDYKTLTASSQESSGGNTPGKPQLNINT